MEEDEEEEDVKLKHIWKAICLKSSNKLPLRKS
jgi:hypothetical protein